MTTDFETNRASTSSDKPTVEAGKEAAASVASTAAESTKEVVSTAVDQTKQVAQDAMTHARDLVGETRSQIRQQAQTQTEQMADGLQRMSTQFRALADGRVEDAGVVGDYARQAASKLGSLAETMQNRGVDGLLDDVKDFARRKPGTFLLGAVVAGFAVGRLARGAQAASREMDNDNNGARNVGPYTSSPTPPLQPVSTHVAPVQPLGAVPTPEPPYRTDMGVR